MTEATLFELPAPQERAVSAPTRPEEARVLRPVREQLQWVPLDLEAAVSQDHAARAIWDLLEKLEKCCWRCGGVPINYHMLADFKGAHQGELDNLPSQIVASLMVSGAVTLKGVAQDGVRASAGAESFRRREAEAQVQRLAQEREHPDPGVSQREQAARERAAKERRERVHEALRQLPAVQAAKERQRRTLNKAKRGRVTEARVSTTDPDVRVMKMPDGGYRPAYNVQLATDVGSGVIVGAAVVNHGNDADQAPPMEDQVARRAGTHPKAYLVDGGYAQRETITTLTTRQIEVYAPVPPPRSTTSGRECSSPRSDDSPAVVAWRQRMATEEALGVYKLRAATAEWANAQARRHGLLPFTVRGLDKVLSVVLLVVIAHNLLRWLALGA